MENLNRSPYLVIYKGSKELVKITIKSVTDKYIEYIPQYPQSPIKSRWLTKEEFIEKFTIVDELHICYSD